MKESSEFSSTSYKVFDKLSCLCSSLVTHWHFGHNLGCWTLHSGERLSTTLVPSLYGESGLLLVLWLEAAVLTEA